MITKKLGTVEFHLREDQDFSWLLEYGEPFSVIDQTGSGCINFGIAKDGVKYFYKIAGAKTTEAEVDCPESIRLLKAAVKINEDIRHPNLCRLIKSFERKEPFVAVYEWVEGDCLLDHWNFDMYDADSSLVRPADRFKALPVEKKLKAAKVLVSFVETVHRAGYAAVDLYDGSIIYDFDRDVLTLCDIDLFLKMPVINDSGEGWYGSTRLKAPEENIKGAAIDERTNVLTLAALIHDMFTPWVDDNVAKRRAEGHFIPLPAEYFPLSEEAYRVILKATNPDREQRYSSAAEFRAAWERATGII